MEPKTHWTHAADYHTLELMLDGNKIIYKDWWDPGHDPNTTVMTVAEFLGGKLHDTIVWEMGGWVLREALATVEQLIAGGPGIAEPPDRH